MDIELLHTFLAVDQARHFGKAAARLCVTQAAVSARIKQLETILGTRLFERNRNNIQLTLAGKQLKLQAETIVGAWQRIRATTDPDAHAAGLGIGTLPDIGMLLLPRWIAALRSRHTGIGGLRLWLDQTPALLGMLDEQAVDLVLTTEPPDRPDLERHMVTNIELVLLSTSKAQACAEALATNYLYTDWGDWFRARHDRHHPVETRERAFVNSATMAATLLLHGQGAAYLPRRLLDLSPWRRRLHPVEDAPVIIHPLYVVTARGAKANERLQSVLTLAKELLTGKVIGESPT